MNPNGSRTRERAYQRRWWIPAALSLSLLIIIIDDTIINVAVPTLQRELGASATALQWIVDSYILVFAGLLLTMGALGDRFGRKRFLLFVLGYPPLQAGLRFLPLAIGFGIAGQLSQRLVPRIGTGRVVAAALGGAALLLAALSQAAPGTSYWLVGAALLLIGVGIGAAFVPSTDAVMAAVPGANAGLGSAINDTGRQVGAALGIGILGTVANIGYTSGITAATAPLSPDLAAAAKRSVNAALQVAGGIGGPTGQALRRAAGTAFMNGFSLAMLAAAALLAVGAVLVLRRLPPQDLPTEPAIPATARATGAPGDGSVIATGNPRR